MAFSNIYTLGKDPTFICLLRESEVTQSCPTLCDPVDCSLAGSSIHGVFQARVLEVGCHFLLQGIFPTEGSNLGLLHYRQTFYPLEPPGKSFKQISIKQIKLIKTNV